MEKKGLLGDMGVGGGLHWEWQKGLVGCSGEPGGVDPGGAGGAQEHQEGCWDGGGTDGSGGEWDSGMGPSLGDTRGLWKEWKVLRVSEELWSGYTRGRQHQLIRSNLPSKT